MQATAALSLFGAVDAMPDHKVAQRALKKEPALSRLRLGELRRTTFRDLFGECLAPLTAIWWTHLLCLTLPKVALELVIAGLVAPVTPGALARAEISVVPYVLQTASTWAFTNGGRTKLLDGTFDIDTDSWKTALFLSTSNIGATSTTYAGVSNEVANANGYTTGGIAVTLTLAGTTTVTVDVSVDPVWTASGGSITARFGVMYEVGGNVLLFTTLDTTPADVTATDGNTLTLATSASGAFTLA